MSRTTSPETRLKRRRVAVAYFLLRNEGYTPEVAHKVLGEPSTVSKCRSDFREDKVVQMVKRGFPAKQFMAYLEQARRRLSVLSQARVDIEIDFVKKALADAKREAARLKKLPIKR